MSRHAKRLRSLVITIIAIAATNIAISTSFSETAPGTHAIKTGKGAVPIIPDPPRPRSAFPMLPDVPRP